MQEIKKLRDKNKKVYDLGNNKRRCEYYSHDIHYYDKENDVYKEPNPSIKGQNIEGLLYNIHYLENDCLISISEDDYFLSINYELHKDDKKMEPNICQPKIKNKETKIKYNNICKNSDFNFLIKQNRTIKPELKMPSFEDVPDEIYLNIKTKNLEIIKKSGYKKILKDEGLSISYPNQLIFKHNKQKVWKINAPFYIDGNGNTRHIPLDIIKETKNFLRIKLEVPKGWLQAGIKDRYKIKWPVILDPPLTKETSEFKVEDGDNITVNIPEGVEIIEAYSEWIAITDTENVSSYNTRRTEGSSFPSLNEGERFSRYSGRYSASVEEGKAQGFVEIRMDGNKKRNSFSGSSGTSVSDTSVNSSISGFSTDQNVTIAPGSEVSPSVKFEARASVRYSTSTERKTYPRNVSIVVGTSDVFEGPSRISNENTWQRNDPTFINPGEENNVFSPGENTLNFSIGGTEEAEYKFVLEYRVVGPIFDDIPDQEITEGQGLQFNINATTQEPGGITYDLIDVKRHWSFSDAPDTMMGCFDPNTQTFSWTPEVGDRGGYLLTFEATNTSTGNSSQKEVYIWVKAAELEVPVNIKAYHTDKTNLHTREYFFKNFGDNIIELKKPIGKNEELPWYPRITSGSFKVPLEDKTNHYGLPEFYKQDFDEEMGPPFVKQEEVYVNNRSRNRLILPHNNIHLGNIHENHYIFEHYGSKYKIPNLIDFYDEHNNIYHPKSWNLSTGEFEIIENMQGRNIYSDYYFLRNYYTYKGYYFNNELVRINLNTNPGQTFCKMTEAGSIQRGVPTHELNNKIIYFYIKPEYQTSGGQKISGTEFDNVVVHTVNKEITPGHPAIRDEIPSIYNFEDILLLGKIYVSIPQDIDQSKTIDTRSRGGGLNE